MRKQTVYCRLKPFLDFLGAFIALLIASPLLIVIILLIELEEFGTNPFFLQQRVGKQRQPFTIIKFRTMKCSAPADVPTHLLDQPEQYITRIGGFLRKSSLDELPQLFNVLAGSLSLIGPRPALASQTDLLKARDQNQANTLKPGITGWAQVNGRDELSVEKKAELDGFYTENLGLTMDIKCFILTFFKVFSQSGVQEGGTQQTETKKKRAKF